MARVLALTADLMFGSRLQSALSSAGYEAELVADPVRLRERLQSAPVPGVAVLIVDLTDPELDGAGELEALADLLAAGATRTLGFYSHVDTQARERAASAGFDLRVPRSRMAREGAVLVGRLAGSSGR
jgi:CheY-like chemotaxis protein